MVKESSHATAVVKYVNFTQRSSMRRYAIQHKMFR